MNNILKTKRLIDRLTVNLLINFVMLKSKPLDMDNTELENQIKKELETLFGFTSAGSLRKSINEIFYSYLMETDKTMLPNNFDTIVADLYFLNGFLNKVEEEVEEN